MKKILLALFFVVVTFCSLAQDNRLIGTWHITECAYITSSGTEKIFVEEIKNGTAITDYFIMENGKYKLTSNMSGSGTTDSYEGEWKTLDDKLKMSITVNNQQMEIEWRYEIKDNLLLLSRDNPMGTLTVQNTYMKETE